MRLPQRRLLDQVRSSIYLWQLGVLPPAHLLLWISWRLRRRGQEHLRPRRHFSATSAATVSRLVTRGPLQCRCRTRHGQRPVVLGRRFNNSASDLHRDCGTKLTFNIVVAVNTLWLMPDRSAWSDCDFTNAVELAGPFHGGGTKLGFNLFQAVVTRPGTLYFACIRSDPFPGNGSHCRTLGQKAQVNIVEASPPPPSPSPPPPSPSPPPPSPLLSPPPPSPSLPTVCVDTKKNCKAGKCLFYELSELWTKLQACKKTCGLCEPLPESLPPSAPP